MTAPITPTSAPPAQEMAQPPKPQLSGVIYDVFILLIIVLGLLLVGIDALLMSGVGETLATWTQLLASLQQYREVWHTPILVVEDWITVFLIAELLLRWLIAIVQRHYHRWFIFPFVHWYEVLGCFPAFRAFRLLRAVAIARKLHQMGYQVIPPRLLRFAQFYYNVILEEISDRIVLNVIDGVERELKGSTTHGHLIRDLIDQHRDQLQAALAELLQHGLAPVLTEHQQQIRHGVGDAVQRAIANTTDLHQLLRLMPVIGGKIEQQVQSIGRQLAENIALELARPFSLPASPQQLANPLLTQIADQVAALPIDTPKLEALVESLVFESLEMLRKQVAVQQWKQQVDDA